ncbi:MAG TPA: flagellar basal body rod protein FlgB [Anaerohalosphaeraceae bacterium]|nr:flagellar basal body rod protein FlgB [Anaerohalosphaeraceae bacterium]HOL87640.1 flagellar basal body rod protein FlgB [Anaerohalosphaeraceae bacterium]HOQ03801.1 flagellar basal body rod protein FlgB [Anaerohalosphaeraceae bacterium]HPP55853.1 flagellar basal body rod protein FlgB [Anaerohalosphaeraceae bacterium]
MIQDNTILNLLEAGMRAEGIRQQAIAHNIANINTPGFRRSDIKFEEILQEALKKNESIDPDSLKPEIYQPQNTPLNEFDNDVSLDSEVGEMVKNTIKHRTYMLILKKKYQQMDAAIKVSG